MSQSNFANISNKWTYAAGPLSIPMTNDYLFRALLQRNNRVLKGLICSLLHLSKDAVESVIINNPIILGESINDKTFFLDISITLNSRTLINLEMQVINEHNWPERSLSYLCRTFDNLNSGNEYSAVKPAIQIGLLNFTLFPEYPEFYSIYQFLNTKNYTKYSDKLRLCVLNLTRIDLADEEDKRYHLDLWASLFKAATWEELKMISKQDELINEASATAFQLSQEDMIRLQCQAREDYYRRQRSVQHMIDSQENTIKDQKQTIYNQEKMITDQKVTINDQKVTINRQEETINGQKVTINDQKVTINRQEETINGQKVMINDQKVMINRQEETIRKQNTDMEKSKMTIRNLTDENALLQKQLADALEQMKNNK